MSTTTSTTAAEAVSAKVWTSTAGSAAVGVVLATVEAVERDPHAAGLDALPAPVLYLLMAALPAVVTFLAGYLKRDRVRDVGAAVTDAAAAADVEVDPLD